VLLSSTGSANSPVTFTSAGRAFRLSGSLGIGVPEFWAGAQLLDRREIPQFEVTAGRDFIYRAIVVANENAILIGPSVLDPA
jgi:hypothetical protein